MPQPRDDIAAQFPAELRKAVTVIHSSGEFSAVERKLFNILILNAYDDLLTRDVHSISTRAVIALLGTDTHNRKFIGKALLALRGRVVEFNLLEDQADPDTPADRRPWTVTGLISEATINGPMLEYSFGRRMAQELFDPAVYAMVNMRVQAAIKSSFTLALYENCVRFVKTGSTGWWDVGLFRKLVGATAPVHASFKELKKRVIVPAVREVCEKSDIVVEVEYDYARTKGRPVERLRFRVSRNKQTPLFGLQDDDVESVRKTPTYRRLIALKLGRQLAQSLAGDPAYGAKLAELIENKSRAGKIKNPAAFARYMVTEGAAVDGVRPKGRGETAAKENAPAGAAPRPVPPPEPVVATPARRVLASDLGPRDDLRFEFEVARTRAYLADLSEPERAALIRTWSTETKKPAGILAYQVGGPGTPYSYDFEAYVRRRVLGEAEEGKLQAWLDRRFGYREQDR